MLGRLVCNSAGSDSTSWYSATPSGWSLPRSAYSATNLVFRFTQEQADGGTVLRVLDLRIHRREVEAQLPEVLRFELSGLQLDHHIVTQLQVIEQRADEKFLVLLFPRQYAWRISCFRVRVSEHL